jgi:polysaccharide export outer membrane protein
MKRLIQMTCLLAVLVFTSCASRKNMIYLQDMDDIHEYPVIQKYEAVIQRDDKLNIVVSSKNPELALAFNIPGTGGYSVGADGTITAGSTGAISAGEDKPGYLVDINGDIDFPILGKLHVEGMTRNQLTEYIKKKLVDSELLKDPIVLVSFLNFKFSVLGEVGHVGTFNVTGDRITLLEAIAMAGDMKETSKIEHVAIIRDYGNKRRMMHVDLRTKDLFLSPAYYLHQNDIIYVEPNKMKSSEQSQRKFQYFYTGASFLTTIVTLVLYFVK